MTTASNLVVVTSQDQIDARRKATGRQCGGCTMCCKVLGVDAPPDFSKPPDTACAHCKPGRGCAIYDDRPKPCRNFVCHWLVDSSLDDQWYPAKSHIVISVSSRPEENAAFIVEVDRDRPGRWLQQPYFEVISQLAITFRGTTVRAGKRWFGIIPLKVAKHPEDVRITTRFGPMHLRPHPVGRTVVTLQGEFVWMEVDAPEAFSDAWRADSREGA
jgi:hypothetical protein